MPSIPSLLTLTHLLGLALGAGCATAKMRLLFKCKADQAFLPAYIAAARPLTRLIVLGIVLLTLSGIGWLVLGYQITPLLVVKLAMVAAIWILGPIIDNVVEPKFQTLAPGSGESATPAFIRIRQSYLLLEIVATGLFYVIIVMWMLA